MHGRKSLETFSYSFILFLAVFGGTAFAGSSKSPIPNFQVVASDVFRGGRPQKDGVAYLKSLGVKTIINLETTTSYVKNETKEAEALGIREINLPMGYLSVNKNTVNEALELIADRSLRPIFVHCHGGHDRTGLIMGLERVEHEGWTPKAAYEEMLKYGFHKIIFPLNSYFKKRTGYKK